MSLYDQYYDEYDENFGSCSNCERLAIEDVAVNGGEVSAAYLARRRGWHSCKPMGPEYRLRSFTRGNNEVIDYCCSWMQRQLEHSCPDHEKLSDCPESLVTRLGVGGYGIRIHDGGNSLMLINHCPWCGTHLAGR
jgi:hypothetical protein